jgi:hypothetical protein
MDWSKNYVKFGSNPTWPSLNQDTKIERWRYQFLRTDMMKKFYLIQSCSFYPTFNEWLTSNASTPLAHDAKE